MTMTPPPSAPQTILGAITQVVKNVRRKVTQPAPPAPTKLQELWVYEPGTPPKTHHLSRNTYHLGRSSSCEIIVGREEGSIVSGTHAVISRLSPRHPFTLRDQNSTNGIYYNGQKITQQELRHGDRFTLGPPGNPKAVELQYSDPPIVETALLNQNLSQVVVTQTAKPARLCVKNAGSTEFNKDYSLLADRITVGRVPEQPRDQGKTPPDIRVISNRSNDHPVISLIHLSLERDPQKPTTFVIKDQNSTNGIFFRKRKIKQLSLRHGDLITLGPPELSSAVQLRFVNPPPWYLQTLLYGVYGFTAISGVVALLILIEWTKFDVYPLPTPINGPVVVLSRDGQTPLRPLNNQAHIERRRLSEFSGYLPKAVIASEDSRYYWHLGIDPIGTLRALLTNLRGGGIREGGSSITQQLARSLFRDYVGTQDSAGRKFREAAVALKMETIYSKDELLLIYLNRVYLGVDLYGFEDGSQFYFGKLAKDLTLSEAATLVGILPAPNSFNPIQNYQLAVEYRDRVINRMRELGMVSQEEADQARRSRINLNPKAVELLQSTIAPYFYGYVFTELEELLGVQLAREGNFIVETGLDPAIQTQAETALRNAVNTTGTTLGFSQGAIVTVDTRNGQIVALVGGVDYQESQFDRATQALRQPGSTFKVFAYASALEQGISPGKSYTCAPLTWQGQSYSGCERSSGAVDMYRGLALSENVTALRVAQDVGLNRVVEMAKRLGIRSRLQGVPGLILGQSEVTVLEMTGAFAVFDNGGVFHRPHAIHRILDSSDCPDLNNLQTCRVIYDYTQDRTTNRPVISPEIANTMTVMLQGVVQGGTGGSAAIGLGEAGKTGTTNDGVDLWFIGYVPSRALATGVWLGNDDNTPTSAGSAQAAQLWGDYMRNIVLRE